MIKCANRLHSVEEYYFSKKLKEVNSLVNQGCSIINLGIGSPDIPPDSSVINALVQSLSDKGAHKYQSYRGLKSLRGAISNFYKRSYNVKLNADQEILPLMGSKAVSYTHLRAHETR